jgi:hypothetical protein
MPMGGKVRSAEYTGFVDSTNSEQDDNRGHQIHVSRMRLACPGMAMYGPRNTIYVASLRVDQE